MRNQTTLRNGLGAG